MAQRLSGGVDPLGVALCGIGAVALAVATLTVRGASAGSSSGILMIVGLQMLVAVPHWCPSPWRLKHGR